MTGSMNSPMFHRVSTASRMKRLTGPLSRAGSACSSPDNKAARCLARATLLASRDWLAAALRSGGTRGRLLAASWSRRDGVGRFLAPGGSAYVIADGVPFWESFLRPNTVPLYVVGLASLLSPVGCQGRSHTGGSLHDTSGYDPNAVSYTHLRA